MNYRKILYDSTPLIYGNRYEYDASGNISAVYLSNVSGSESLEWTYTYDSMNQLIKDGFLEMNVDENRKLWKRFFTYTKKGQVIEEELTFDKFINGLENGLEYYFTYRDHCIDVAYHFDGSDKIYEVNLDGYGDHPRYYSFKSVNDLITFAILEEKTIQELWDDLET